MTAYSASPRVEPLTVDAARAAARAAGVDEAMASINVYRVRRKGGHRCSTTC
jgi:hypothetical protein